MLIPYKPDNPKERIIELWVGKSVAYVDGVKYDLDQPVTVNPQTGRTLVPLRFISENLGRLCITTGKTKRLLLN